MKLTILSVLIASAAAFAPAQTSNTITTELSAGKSTSPFANEIGAQAPLGFFDPLGMVGDGTQARFDRLRLVEVKHGRVAMMAVVGYLTTYAGVRSPGMENVPAGFDAIKKVNWDTFDVKANMIGTAVFIGMLEFVFMKDQYGLSEFPGDFRNGSLDFGWDKFDEATKVKKRSIELNNGRAAQMGILGLMVHEQMGNVDAILP